MQKAEIAFHKSTFPLQLYMQTANQGAPWQRANRHVHKVTRSTKHFLLTGESQRAEIKLS
jgi:hypothetical protein